MLNKLSNELLDIIITECKKEENQTKLKSFIIDPIICYTMDKLYPYIFITIAVFILIIVIFILIIAYIFSNKSEIK